MMVRLSEQERTFLLGQSEKGKTEASVSVFTIHIIEFIEKILPSKLAGILVLFGALTVMPVLGVVFLVQQVGIVWSFAVMLGTASAGAIMVQIHGRACVRQMLDSLREGEFPALESIHKAQLAICGLMLMLPGLVVNLAALVLLIPPLSRVICLAAYRKLRGSQEEPL